MLLYWIVVFPLFCLFSLVKNRAHLDQSDMKFRFGFFYIGYKEDYYFWEFVIMYRKIFTICISMINESVIFAKGALVLLLNSISFSIQVSRMPFTDQNLNYLESLSIKVSIVTIFGGLFYIQQSFGDFIQAIIFILIIMINLYFTLAWLSMVLGHAFKKYANNRFIRSFGLFFRRMTSIVNENISSNFLLLLHF